MFCVDSLGVLIRRSSTTLVHQAIGDRLHFVFIDNHLLRYEEGERVMAMFEAQVHLPVMCIDVSAGFLHKLKGMGGGSRNETKDYGRRVYCRLQ